MKRQRFGKLGALICVILAFVLVFSLTACSNKKSGSSGLKLNNTSVSVDVGSESSVLVTSNVSEDVVWSSSDEAVATVEGSGKGKRMGKITGVAVGTATITATVGNNKATCKVTVTNPEVITITNGGTAVNAPIALSKDQTAQLTATSSKEHNIVWTSTKPQIVSVSETGLITALATSGSATITATCEQHSDAEATVSVVIGSGEDSQYYMKTGSEGTAVYAKEHSEWCAWTEWGGITEAEYSEGVAKLVFANNEWTEAGGEFYCVQLFYASAANNFTEGTTYKLSFKLKAVKLKDVDGNDTNGGRVTVNGSQIRIKKSDAPVQYDVYYNHNNSLCDFSMQFGQAGQFPTDIKSGEFYISDVSWSEAGATVKLATPSFTYNSTAKTIAITDTNPENSCTYRLDFYSGATLKGSTVVENGKAVDTSAIPNGTYNVYLVAVSSNPHFTNSDKSSSTASIAVSNDKVLIAAGDQTAAIRAPGSWKYFTMGGAVVNPAPYIDGNGTIHIAYTGNTGNGGYGMQMFFEDTTVVTGNNYVLHCVVKSLGSSGYIIVNGNRHDFNAANEEFTFNVTYTESGGDGTESSGYNGASAAIVFGTGDGSFEISGFSITAA